jgi:hypothetical protein
MNAKTAITAAAIAAALSYYAYYGDTPSFS